MDRVRMNQERIARANAYKDSKKRKGGISNDAWKDLRKKDRKKLAADGRMQRGFFANKYDEDKFDNKNKLWENAAWSMGMGNVKSGDDLKKLHKKYTELGIKDFDSMEDVKGFDNTSKKNIDKQIEDAIAARMEEFNRNQEEAEEDNSLEPEPVAGASDWQSQYMEVINKFLEQMGNNQQQQNPYLPQQQAQPWTPRGGW